MIERTLALYADLARSLGLNQDALPIDERGSLQLNVGDEVSVVLFPENDSTLMLLSAVMPLPLELDHGSTLWLLRRGFHDSPIAPFQVSCDKAGTLVVWGRVPIAGMTGEALGDLLDALSQEVELIRAELARDSA